MIARRRGVGTWMPARSNPACWVSLHGWPQYSCAGAPVVFLEERGLRFTQLGALDSLLLEALYGSNSTRNPMASPSIPFNLKSKRGTARRIGNNDSNNWLGSTFSESFLGYTGFCRSLVQWIRIQARQVKKRYLCQESRQYLAAFIGQKRPPT